MIILRRYFKTLFVAVTLAVAGCAIIEENQRKNPQLGLITTPPSYYTTQKARYLGEKFKNNLDRLVERISSNPKTANLQFANNIASVGGIGFFTHSATSLADERFLEVIMGVPETFDSKLDHETKVHRVFSLYGAELLSILASDADIYQEKQVNGYGLNLSWRNVVADAAGPRISLERSTLYFSKARVPSFLQGDLTQNSLLSEAVIFAVVDDGPMKLVSYRPQELKPDSRRPIQEQPLIAGRIPVKREEQLGKSASLGPVAGRSTISKEETGDSAQSSSNDKLNNPEPQPALTGKREDWNEAASAGDKPEEVLIPSAAPSQPSTRELSVVEVKDDVVAGKQASVDGAALEPNETGGPQYSPTKVDLASLPASPAVTRHEDAPRAELLLKEQPFSESIQAKTLKGAETDKLPALKVLQGFVIQVTFVDPRDARYWAETLEGRGFAVSLTETGDSGSRRLRIGNFTGREEAERQLQALRQEGLKGVVLNLPQAYRPEVRPPTGEGSARTLPAVQ